MNDNNEIGMLGPHHFKSMKKNEPSRRKMIKIGLIIVLIFDKNRIV
ncbi:MAG: hypothetical protein ACFFBP_19010 [Promethearchaeota archaeon]